METLFWKVALDEDKMIVGEGNQFVEVGNKVYHYARWTINPNLEQSELEYLE
jgi:hypothetical protein